MKAAEYALLTVVVVVIAYLVITPITQQTTDLFNDSVAVFEGVN